MRRNLLLVVLLSFVMNVNAQQREIRMPEETSRNRNIAEMDQGFWCAIEAGGGSTLMEGRKNLAMTGASFVGGFRFSQYLKVGVGLGILYYPNNSNVRSRDSHLAMPVMANVRGNILSDDMRRTVPYWSVNVGSTLPDGLFFSPSVGLRIGEKRNAFLVSMGYTLRRFKVCEGKNGTYSGALLKLGYEF